MPTSANDSIIPGFDDRKNDALDIILERDPAKPGLMRIHLSNRIDNYNAPYFQRSIEKVIFSGYRRLVFSCAALGYVSSTGVGAFINIMRTLKSQGGDMVFTCMQDRVRDVFDILGFAGYFTFCDDEKTIFASTEQVALPTTIFPLVFSCPSCSRRMKTGKPGKFACSSCTTRFVVLKDGRVKPLKNLV